MALTLQHKTKIIRNSTVVTTVANRDQLRFSYFFTARAIVTNKQGQTLSWAQLFRTAQICIYCTTVPSGWWPGYLLAPFFLCLPEHRWKISSKASLWTQAGMVVNPLEIRQVYLWQQYKQQTEKQLTRPHTQTSSKGRLWHSCALFFFLHKKMVHKWTHVREELVVC